MPNYCIMLRALIVLLWPLSVQAAQATFAHSLSEMSVPDLLIALFITSLTGLTALLAQMESEYKTKEKIDRLPLYAASKLLGANLAGMAVYVFTVAREWDIGAQVISTVFAAFGGTWLLQRVVTSVVINRFPLPPETKP